MAIPRLWRPSPQGCLRKMGVFISILSKILLCLTLQAWLLAASGSSTPAGEAGAASESLTFAVKGKAGISLFHPYSAFPCIVMLLGAGPAPKGRIWRSVGRLRGSARHWLFSAQMVLQIFPPPALQLLKNEAALSLSHGLLSLPSIPHHHQTMLILAVSRVS